MGLMHPFRRAWRALRPIRVRLTLWYVALLTVTLLAFSAILYVNLSSRLYVELDRLLVAEGQQLNALVDVDKRRIELEAQRGERLEPGTVVALYDLDGNRVYTNHPEQPLPTPGERLVLARRGQETLTTAETAGGSRWRVITRPAIYRERVVGVLQVARDQRAIEATLSSLLFLVVLAIPAMVVPAVAGGLFLAGRALNPIDRIVRAADDIGAEDLSRRLNMPATPDEPGRLAATFDRMLDRLDRAFRRQRQFTADAAHELRTPLAMLRTQADLALARRRSAGEYRAALESIRADAARLSELVGELLTLARADVGREALVLETLPLNALVDDVVAAMAPLAEQRGVRLERGRDEPPTVVHADQTRLTQLVVNLLDNGIKYTPAGGAVTVSVGQLPRWAVLQVADTGVGIAPEHLPHLFDRFYRVDAARSRAEGGAGLGLAISQWIAQAHGGEIAVDSQLHRGTTFTLRLPLVFAPAPTDDRRTEVPGAPIAAGR